MIDISDEEINSLTAAIMQRHGVDFTCYEPKSLKRRIIRALSVFKLNSIHELWVKILKEKEFVSPFVNELSVGLTAMFRDPGFWIRLKDILPTLIGDKKSISIWHAGCSTGEEVFSLNILTREIGLEGRLRSLASDMNSDALKSAQEGKYHLLKLQDYDHNYLKYAGQGSLEKYYEQQGKVGAMDLSLIRDVKFKVSNLITDQNHEKYDIIFCRNVMIYFDSGAKKLVLNKFYDCLNTGGLLIIGFFDALVPIIDKERFEFYDLNQRIFRRIN
ncbi:protein-glutamate O-methyltransferase CheR [Fulvivirga sp. 29W222]|uniref:Protein-glutamate O-methyltransferase CheR n=1 Tax=Fulvivirga marina TaxID=2494733 RepID=A0A937FYC0_9BACT|nr:CheR family methyltransferase [Fulvivirga marina]MBL6447042.1 protein-glutamate O-methyltransferase CheR [Fulvivirga marina]